MFSQVPNQGYLLWEYSVKKGERKGLLFLFFFFFFFLKKNIFVLRGNEESLSDSKQSKEIQQ